MDINRNGIEEQQIQNRLHSRLRRWMGLLICVFLTWAFIFYIGPALRDSIPVWKELTEVARERDIDTTTFFYSETKEFYEAERNLRETFELKRPRGYGFNSYFILGIVSCIAILAVGFKLMSRDVGTKSGDHG